MSENKKVAKSCFITSFKDLVAWFQADLKDLSLVRYNYVRVCKSVAREILAENRAIVIGGEVKHFSIENIGLGCYQVCLNDGDETLYFKRQK